MKKSLFILLFFPLITRAQVVISSGTTMATTTDSEVSIVTTGNISNNSTNADFSNAKLYFELTGGVQTLLGSFNLIGLRLNGIGAEKKTISNTITVSGTIDFTNGILVPATAGKILFTGSDGGIINNNSSSYVEGIFYSQGTGNRIFPVGTSTAYAPLTFPNITFGDQEIGVQALDVGAGITPDGVEILSVVDNRSWEIVSPTDASIINSEVTLGLDGVDVSGTGGTAVVQADNGLLKSLGSSSVDASNVTSRGKVTASILTIGKVAEINVKVHDIITPSAPDEFNDQLYIENIDRFDFNKVTLLDRYGVLIKEWKDFRNYNDPSNPNTDGFDFKKMSPGNYICVVEYGNDGDSPGKISQMVTVLNTN